MNGKLDNPCLQTFRLRKPMAIIAPPNNPPVVKPVGFLEKRNPIRPPPNTIPPVPEKYDYHSGCYTSSNS